MSEALVLLPDMMCDARLFTYQINALSQERPVMVAPITQGERIEEIASGLLEQLPEHFAVAGVGMGGMVAMELLRRATNRVARIALLDTNPLADTPAIAAARDLSIVGARSGRLEEILREMVRPEHLAPGPGRVEVMNVLCQMGCDLGPDVFVRQSRALQRRRDQQSTLRKCKVPTLVLCGAHDTLTPVKRHKVMAELIPAAELRVIEDAGHLPVLERPEETTDALRGWLAQPLMLRQPQLPDVG